MKKNINGYRNRDEENRFFLKEDLITNIDTVNKLFNFVKEAQSLCEKQASSGALWSKQQIISLYKNIYTFGMYDKIIERLNKLYLPLGNTNLFTIDKEFIDNHYESLSDRREIAAAGMELGNRLSKVPGQLIKRNIIQMDKDRNTTQNATRQWNDEYVGKLSKLYNEYIKSSNQWLFMEEVTIRDDLEKPGYFIVESNNKQEYSEFEQWFKNQTHRLSGQKSFHCMLRDFYMYSKLKYCESYFYQMKVENMAELITMQEQGDIGIKITDSTKFDNKYGKGRENTILLSTELPGYSKPYIFHFRLDKLNMILGRQENEPLNIEPTLEKHLGHTYFSHKLTEKQIEYINKLQCQELNIMPVTRGIIKYMKYSSIKKREYEIAVQKLEREKSKKADEEVQKKMNHEETRTKRRRLIEDKPFTDELCENIQSNLEIYIPEDYKYNPGSKMSLMYKSEKQKMKLSLMYNYMRDFLQIKLSETGKAFSTEDLTDEANKMYVYMKLCGRGFWNLVYNDKRTVILEEVYKEYEDKFNIIAKAIQEGVPIEGLRYYVKKETSPNLKNGSSKDKKDFKGKKGIAKGLSDKKKKTKEELIKQVLINSIETKKEQIELKKRELVLLQEELKRLEKLNKTMDGNYNIGDDD